MKKSKKKAAKKAVKKAASKKKTVSKISAAPVNKSGIIPLMDRVIISPTMPETTTSFGLIIPDTAEKEKAETGVVVAVGPGKMGDDNMLIPVGVSVGDQVLFEKYRAEEVKIHGKTYVIVSEEYILAILK